MATEPTDPKIRVGNVPELDRFALMRTFDALERYAEKLLRRHAGSSARARLQAEDLASEAFTYALENLAGLASSRTWDPEKVGMLTFCRGVIKSRVSNHFSKTEAHKVTAIDDDQDIVNLDHIDFESLLILKQNVSILTSNLDEFALRVLDIIIQNGSEYSNEMIADQFGCDCNDIRNARARIFRAGRKIARQ